MIHIHVYNYDTVGLSTLPRKLPIWTGITEFLNVHIKELHINSLTKHCSYSDIVKWTRRDSKQRIPAIVRLGRINMSRMSAKVRNH